MTTTTMTVFVGAPGAGKSDLAKAFVAAGVEVLGLDELRGQFGAHVGDQLATAPAVRCAVERVIGALREGRSVALDATSSTPNDRAPWLGIGSAFNVPVVAVVLRTDLEVCRERNDQRWGVQRVPLEWLTAAWAAIAVRSAGDLRGEGFTEVVEPPVDADRAFDIVAAVTRAARGSAPVERA